MNYTVYDESGNEVLFIAPALQLARILNLHPDAVRRLRAETVNGGVCRLHGNGKMFLGAYPVVLVEATDK